MKGLNVFEIKSLPENWKACRLEEVVGINGGSQPTKSTFTTVPKEGFVRLIQIRDYKSDKFPTFVPEKSTKKFCSKDDIMIGRYGPPVFQILRGLEGAYNVALMKAVPKSNMHREYLYYLLTSSPIQNLVIGNSQRTAGQSGVNLKLLNDCIVPLPPLATQKKIAAILDAADAHLQKTKQLLAKYEELAQSIFLEMFGDPVTNSKGWEVKKFSDVAKIDTRMTTDFKKFGDLPHIGVANIEKEIGKLVNYNLVRDEGLISGKYHFGPNHIIYSKIRPNLNKVALPNFEGLCSADAYPILAIKGVSNRYFVAFILRSKAFLDHILQHSARTNIPKANKSQIQAFNCICPPYKIQQEFSKKLVNLQIQKQLLEESENNGISLFNSLLQKAFKGELVK
jgi:type I restriction enzyme S subunit